MSRIEISMKHRLVVLSLCYCCMNWSAMANAKNVVPTERKQQVISNVDTSLEGTQKYVLRVTGTPFYMTNIQLRLDLLRYSEEWSMDLCEKLVAQVAADGFNTVSVPVHWYEVEPKKDRFDWTILDSYLKLVNKYGLKMEMLWFGANSGGHVQWLGRPNKNAVHLRTPDYVLYSPSPSSKETTSEFTIRRDMSDYTLDIADDRLRERETYVLKEVMNASDKTRIQYANKYAGSSNYWKNSIGMNKAIIDNDVLGTKEAQEERFAKFAKEKNNPAYMNVVKEIDDAVAITAPLVYQATCLTESFFSAIEFGSPYQIMEKLEKALEEKNDSAVNANIKVLENVFASIHNKDYDHEVDRKVAKVLFPLYAEMIPAEQRPAFYSTIEKEYKGDYNKFIDAMYDSSIMANQANFDKFIKKPTVKAIKKDLATQYSRAKYESLMSLSSALKAENEKLASLHKTYIRGLEEMKLPVPSYPDANFTIRLTYGNVKPYSPRDGVFYKFYTTTDGIIEKEDPENREFNVPAKLKELIEKKDFGRYAMPNGDMPVCFLSTNDITGGNSGSPVLNENGELIGCAFDGNWESLSGDINFDNDLQRCINLDIRYVLFILEKLGGCGHLINEMTIVE